MNELPVSNEIFQRCSNPIIYETDSDPYVNQATTSVLAGDYAPTSHSGFNLAWEHPVSHTSVQQYAQHIGIPPTIPVYREPVPNAMFPAPVAHARIPQPKQVSVLPLLITAQRSGLDITRYKIVSGRSSLRKIAMNNEDYVIGVQRCKSTLFLRRLDIRNVNMASNGHRFEQLCTPDYHIRADYHRLVEGRIGELRTLITAEIDAVSVNGEAIELKCASDVNIPIGIRRDYWLQAFLGGVTRIVFGSCLTAQPPRLIGAVHAHEVGTLLDDKEKDTLFQRLNNVLSFLYTYARENGSVYLFARHTRQGAQHGSYLYRVMNHEDRHRLTFVSEKLLCEVVASDRPAKVAFERRTRRPSTEDDGEDEYDDFDFGDDYEGAFRDNQARENERKKENAAMRRSWRK